MRVRVDAKKNYKAVFNRDGFTIRQKIDPFKPFGTVSPEVEDVAINNKCLANCPYCYTNALSSGINFNDIISKIKKVYNKPLNELPFQIAIGGAGEPTLHPDFVNFLEVVHDMGIMPNYTTNGMHLSDTILNTTYKLGSSVALSFHPHMTKVYNKAINQLRAKNINTNVHVIIGAPHSLEHLKFVIARDINLLKFIVLLPYMPVGRAPEEPKRLQVWQECFNWAYDYISDHSKVAIGALFLPFLENRLLHSNFEFNIYDPEAFSGYRILDDRYETLFKSSYNLTPK